MRGGSAEDSVPLSPAPSRPDRTRNGSVNMVSLVAHDAAPSRLLRHRQGSLGRVEQLERLDSRTRARGHAEAGADASDAREAMGFEGGAQDRKSTRLNSS